MDTKIISAFPGTGKSYFYNNNKDISIDSDSSGFSWIINEQGEKERNPIFPNNYIEHIKENIGKYKFIFVSSHKEVRDALNKENIEYFLVYPNISLKENYIERYKNRGNTDAFINLVDTNWNNWINEIVNDNTIYNKIELNENLTDLLNNI